MKRKTGSPLAKSKSNLLRLGLSLFIVFHLVVIVVLANGSSFAARRLQSTILPYANALGLNQSWNFFSPDPAHTMYYRFEIYYRDADGNDIKPPEEGFYPPEKDQIVIDSSKRRLLYAMRFLTIDPSRVKTLLGPWLCRQHPGASEVFIDHVLEQIPFLDVAVTQIDEPVHDLLKERHLITVNYNCLHPEDEVGP